MHEVAPSPDDFPVGQAVQAAAPEVSEKVPLAHREQELAPAWLKNPGGHAMHLTPSADDVPGAHG
jgi:hypothetical protein